MSKWEPSTIYFIIGNSFFFFRTFFFLLKFFVALWTIDWWGTICFRKIKNACMHVDNNGWKEDEKNVQSRWGLNIHKNNETVMHFMTVFGERVLNFLFMRAKFLSFSRLKKKTSFFWIVQKLTFWFIEYSKQNQIK